MAAIISFSTKQPDGSYKNYTMGINDDTNQYGQNVSVWEEQTKEERQSKKKRNYIANGRVVWNDGVIKNAEKTTEDTSDLF